MTQQPRPIEAMWQYFRHRVIRADVDQASLSDARTAFFAGVAAMWKIVHSLDDGDDLTHTDKTRLADIATELEAFIKALEQESALNEIDITDRGAAN